MKSIFSICLLLTTAVSVLGQPKELNGIVGESVTFPASGKQGRLMYNSDPIAVIHNGESLSFFKKEYEGRLHWDSNTGFSLSRLQKNDTGVYKVVKHDGLEVKYQLNVYEDNVPVSTPNVRVLRDQYPCILLCAVDRGTEATLSWYREGEATPYVTSSVHSAPDLDLPVPVEKGGIYTCVVKNSVSNKTSDPLTVGDHCTAPRPPDIEANTSSFQTWAITVTVIAVTAILIIVILVILRCKGTSNSAGSSVCKKRGGSEPEAAKLAAGGKPQTESSP